jgi:2,5-diketo-D-gluconate reductase A
MQNPPNEVKRREFLKKSAALAAATLFAGAGSSKLLGAAHPTLQKNGIPAVKLNNGVSMPMIGFGTNTLTGERGVRCVVDAISVGYRLIDTATVYGNEEAVGEAIKKSGIKREELFLTSKVWVDDSGYEKAKKAFQISLDKLGVEYLDLYLIHRPRGDVQGSWKAMEDLNREGKIRAIGVSNFEPQQLDELMAYASIKPAVNQIETHVFFQQHKSYEHLKKAGIQMEAWSPFAAARNEIFSNPVLAAIGVKHDKTIAQVCLRWHYQRGIVTIPRSSQKLHMIENLDIFDFVLDEADLKAIAPLDLNTTQFPEWE